MRQMAFLFRGIDQVTLSTCNSATQGGEGAEIDGLAMVAQEKGAAAVLASLWPVADVSTPALMREYYARRKAGSPGPEALQAAQVAMIRGTLGPAGEREPGWRHPFFWAPFILLGSAR
jgi:CHAT domain-containing protein